MPGKFWLSFLFHQVLVVQFEETDAGKAFLELVRSKNTEFVSEALNSVRTSQNLLDYVDREGEFPLLVATRHNKTKTVQLLLEYGANVNRTSPCGTSCLHLAGVSMQMWLCLIFLGSEVQ